MWSYLHERFDLSRDASSAALAAALVAMEQRDSERPSAADGRISRWQDDIIAEHIPGENRVLDLGCGDGALLHRLQQRGQQVQGVELDLARVRRCIRRGVPVIHADIDAGLQGFTPDSFDVVVLEETLQTLQQPIATLQHAARRSLCRRKFSQF